MDLKKTIAVAAFLVLLPVFAAEAAITLLYPVPKSWVSRSDYLIFKLNNPDITSIKITINGIASDLMLISSSEYKKAFHDFVIMQPVWDPGKNEVVIEGFNGEKKLETAPATVFFTNTKDVAAVPAEYKKNVLHVPEMEKLCSPCHNMIPTSAQVDNTLDGKNPCYKCHKKIANLNYVHGPVGTFSCAYCHSLEGTPKYAVTKRDAALCGDCHADKTAEFSKRKFLHGPVEAEMCEICHDPHSSNNPGQLHLPINALCLSCHENIAKDTHIVRLSNGNSHPLSGKPDPTKPGKELSCVSCHNPHASDVRYFFQTNTNDRMQLCQMCHNK